MFNPLDFLEFAEELKFSVEDEAKIRTAISRAYYSAFLKTREWLRAKEWPVYGDARDHREVPNGLRSFLGRSASDKLGRLRRCRGDADYNLTKSLIEKDVNYAITLAQTVIKRCL